MPSGGPMSDANQVLQIRQDDGFDGGDISLCTAMDARWRRGAPDGFDPQHTIEIFDANGLESACLLPSGEIRIGNEVVAHDSEVTRKMAWFFWECMPAKRADFGRNVTLIPGRGGSPDPKVPTAKPGRDGRVIFVEDDAPILTFESAKRAVDASGRHLPRREVYGLIRRWLGMPEAP